MEIFDIILFSIVAAVVLTIIVKSWTRPTDPRAEHSNNPDITVERPAKGSRVMIWGPALFVTIFSMFMPTRLAYERVQGFPEFLAYGLMVSAAAEVFLYVFVTRILIGPVLNTLILRIEGTHSEELNAFYVREYQKFSRISLVLAIMLATAGAINLLLAFIF